MASTAESAIQGLSASTSSASIASSEANGSPNATNAANATNSPSSANTTATSAVKTALQGRVRNNVILLGIASAILIAMGVLVYGNCYNFDVWYMIATGREVLENGIPYDNPFSQHEGAQIIVQQWLLCIILYLIYSAFDMAGLAGFVTILGAAIMFSAYKLGRLKKGDKFGGEIIAFLCIPLLLALDIYMKMGSSVVSMLIFIWLIYFCEKYRQTGKYLWLALLLPLALIHVQFHMAFVMFDLAIIFCYLIPNIPAMIARRRASAGSTSASEKTAASPATVAPATSGNIAFAQSDYKRIPLLIAFVAYAALLCVNPYGIRGVMYFFLSYGAADYMGDIPEMLPMMVGALGINGVGVLVLILLAFMAIAKRGLKRIDLPLTLLVLVTTVMAFQHTRNCWLAPLFGYILVCGAIGGWSWSLASVKAFFSGKRAQVVAGQDAAPTQPAATQQSATQQPAAAPFAHYIIAVVLCAVAAIYALTTIAIDLVPMMNNAEKTSEYTPMSLVDTIADDPKGDDVKVFNPVRLGGYLEWRGITPYIDSRVEVWNSPISGQDGDYYYDYVDMSQNKWPIERYQEFLDENDFDYVITESNSTLENYIKDYSEDFVRLKGNNEFTLWKKAENLEESRKVDAEQ